MDDAAQSPKTQDDAGQQGASVQQTTHAPPVQQPQPTQPVSLPHKEFASGQATSDYELVAPSDQEPTLHPEVAEAGVEVAKNNHLPKIHPDAEKLGVALSKEATPVITAPSGKITLPLTEEKAKEAKKLSTKFSIRWLAELVLEQLKRWQQKSSIRRI